MIVMTFAVLLLLPVGAWAVSFSNVAITDPGGVNQAKVDSGKNLHTAVADPAGVNVAKVDAKNNLNTAVHDAVSGVAAKVNTLGQQLAAITGSVTANVAYPTSSIIHSPVIDPTDCSSGPCATLLAPPTGKALVVASVHVNTYFVSNPGPGVYVSLFRSNDGTSSTTSLDLLLEMVNPGGVGITQLQYDLPGGMTIPAGKALCARISSPSSLLVEATAWGYSVPSTAVPAAAPVAGAQAGVALLEHHQ
jgi:hypothetical protein